MIIQELKRLPVKKHLVFYMCNNILFPAHWFKEPGDELELAIYDSKSMNSVRVQMLDGCMMVKGCTYVDPLMYKMLSRYGSEVFLRVE